MAEDWYAKYLTEIGWTPGGIDPAGGSSLESQLHAARVKSLKIERYLDDLAAKQSRELQPLQGELLTSTDSLRRHGLREQVNNLTAEFRDLEQACLDEQRRLRDEIEGLERLIAIGSEED